MPLWATVYCESGELRVHALVVVTQVWAEPTSVEPSYSRSRRHTSLPGVSLRTEPRAV